MMSGAPARLAAAGSKPSDRPAAAPRIRGTGVDAALLPLARAERHASYRGRGRRADHRAATLDNDNVERMSSAWNSIRSSSDPPEPDRFPALVAVNTLSEHG
jgi:hypothetical protein